MAELSEDEESLYGSVDEAALQLRSRGSDRSNVSSRLMPRLSRPSNNAAIFSHGVPEEEAQVSFMDVADQVKRDFDRENLVR